MQFDLSCSVFKLASRKAVGENMVGQLLKGLITDPGNAIAAGKREHSMKHTWMLLGIDWLVAAIAVLLGGEAAAGALGSFSGLASIMGGIAAVAVLIGGVLLTAFVAFLLKLAINALGGKGTYFEALSSLVYALWPLSLGSLVAAILLFGGVFGAFIAGIALAVLGVLAIAIAFRSVKEMFGIDYITTLIAFGVLGIGLSIATTAASSAAAATVALKFVHLMTGMMGNFQMPAGFSLPGIIPG